MPDQLDPDAAYEVGRAVASWSQAPEILVGRDGRLSSPALAAPLMDGLLDGGVTVLDTGLVTTPMLNYAVARHGPMVTASHNPKEYNGIKLIDPQVEQVYYGRGLEAVENLVLRRDFGQRRGRGRVRMRSVLHDYEDHLVERFADLAFPSLWFSWTSAEKPRRWTWSSCSWRAASRRGARAACSMICALAGPSKRRS